MITTVKDLLLRLYVKYIGSPDPVDFIGSSEKLPPPLSREEEQQAFDLLESDRPRACETLIVHNLRLVVYIAKKYESPFCTNEDMISIGTIGLIKAVRSFDPKKNIKLATYASRCIENEILMFMRKASHRAAEISIDEPLNTDRDGNELFLSDMISSDEETAAEKLSRECERRALMDEIARLSPRERQIMELRFGLADGRELTQKEVADRIGISQSYISRLEKKIIKRIRENLASFC